MTRKEALTELLEKVKAGEVAPFHGFSDIDLDLFTQGFIDDAQRACHGSMDAALSLFEAVLPGWIWARTYDGLMIVKRAAAPMGKTYIMMSGYHETPSRALLIAILEALVEMES